MHKPYRTSAFWQGWRSCEAGKNLGDNPYLKSGSQTKRIDWHLGHEARAEKGFDVSRLPRKPSGAFN